jgi:uncharacterized protein YdaT
MLKEILVISGKPGLHRLVSKGSNLLIVESLIDKKRMPAYARDKVISLGDISIYTKADEISIRDVLSTIKEKEGGNQLSGDLIKSDNNGLLAYFAGIVPDFDRERVYPTDIKKILKWYNLLLAEGITDFAEKKEEGGDATESVTSESSEEEKQEAQAKKETAAKSTKRKDDSKSIIASQSVKGGGKAQSSKAGIPKKSTVGVKRGG